MNYFQRSLSCKDPIHIADWATRILRSRAVFRPHTPLPRVQKSTADQVFDTGQPDHVWGQQIYKQLLRVCPVRVEDTSHIGLRNTEMSACAPVLQSTEILCVFPALSTVWTSISRMVYGLSKTRLKAESGN